MFSTSQMRWKLPPPDGMSTLSFWCSQNAFRTQWGLYFSFFLLYKPDFRCDIHAILSWSSRLFVSCERELRWFRLLYSRLQNVSEIVTKNSSKIGLEFHINPFLYKFKQYLIYWFCFQQSTLDRKKKNFTFSRKFPFMKSRDERNEDGSDQERKYQ